MTPRERVEAVLRGRMPDQVPFTIYANKLPRCQVELELRNAGACILERSPVVVRTIRKGVFSVWILRLVGRGEAPGDVAAPQDEGDLPVAGDISAVPH